jgi:hypothetical protein
MRHGLAESSFKVAFSGGTSYLDNVDRLSRPARNVVRREVRSGRPSQALERIDSAFPSDSNDYLEFGRINQLTR